MAYDLKHAIVIERARKAIHVIRIEGELLDEAEIAELCDSARQHLLAKYGEQDADVVFVQGSTKEDFRMFGPSTSVSRARAALFNAALSWSPIDFD